MIELWLATGLLLLVALAFLLIPVLRGRKAQAEEDRTALNVALYQERLAELQGQHASGSLTAEQLQAGQDEAARVVVCNPIEQRHQRATGAAPGGPEIDEDRLRVRGLHHVGHEVGNGGNDFLCGFRHGSHPGSLNGKFSRAAGLAR